MLWGLVILLTLFQLSNGGWWGQRLHPGQGRGLDSLTHRLLLGLTYKTDGTMIHLKRMICHSELVLHEHNLTHIPAGLWLTDKKSFLKYGKMGKQNEILRNTRTIFI